MTDFHIDSTNTAPRVDTRWRTSKFGKDHARPGTLDLTQFREGVHYNIGGRTDNVIPSGVAVTLDPSTGLYVPAEFSEHEDGDHFDEYAGFINDDQGIDVYRRAGVAKSEKAAFALLVHGILDASYLPLTGQRELIHKAPTTGQFIYV